MGQSMKGIAVTRSCSHFHLFHKPVHGSIGARQRPRRGFADMRNAER
jgi:hypothetical protein